MLTKTMVGQAMVLGGLVLSCMSAAAHAGQLKGDYIEARSASVYAGPCHYSNEAVTAGDTATLAWRFDEGEWKGVSLKGLSAVAVLKADKNLAEDTTSRRSVLYLDMRATPAQTAALRSLFNEKYGATLGRILAVKAAATEVSHDGLNYRVRVAGEKAAVARLDVNRYPCSHCTQAAQIWYQPFVDVQNVIVGKTTRNVFRDAALNTAWDDSQEANSAFVGQFAL
ncbi:MAG: DUF1326 domain-containing protein [Armatimonadota bacterium]|nr:DUF1326 domain-containing protein [Armatimonadota bacterium]